MERSTVAFSDADHREPGHPLSREEQNAWAWVGSIRLEDSEGAWTGQEYGMGEWIGERLALQPRMMLLTGEGAYEGLSAMLQRLWETDDPTYPASVEGFIFEDELPPMPEVMPAEQSPARRLGCLRLVPWNDRVSERATDREDGTFRTREPPLHGEHRLWC